MNKDSENKSLPDIVLNEQTFTTNYSHVKKLKKGNFDERQYLADFWSDAKTETYTHVHLREQKLRTHLTYQYKYVGNNVYLRTLQYHMTSRPSDKYWYRANINILLFGSWVALKESPDAMWQDDQLHNYVVELSVSASFGPASLFVGVEYDGTDNGVGRKDHWGPAKVLDKY